VRGTLAVYRERFARGRVYSPVSYLLGSFLRRRFTEAGAVAWLRGPPMPRIEKRNGEIRVADVALYPGVAMVCRNGGRITVGDGTYINRNSFLYAEKEISIGEGGMISWDVIITDTDGFGERGGPGRTRPVSIGRNAWIGSRVVILGGSTIGDGAVVAAGSVVQGHVKPGEIVARRPARELHAHAAAEEMKGGAA